MTNKTAAVIAAEIQQYITSAGQPYGAWYAGITNNPDRRLFQEHCVSKNGPWWIWREAMDDGAARAIEDYFLRLGCKGGAGGGESDCVYVYAYLIRQDTVE